jgi:hypothetical protein
MRQLLLICLVTLGWNCFAADNDKVGDPGAPEQLAPSKANAKADEARAGCQSPHIAYGLKEFLVMDDDGLIPKQSSLVKGKKLQLRYTKEGSPAELVKDGEVKILDVKKIDKEVFAVKVSIATKTTILAKIAFGGKLIYNISDTWILCGLY